MMPVVALMVLGGLQSTELAPPEIPVRPEFFRPPNYGPTLCDISRRMTVEMKQSASSGTVSMPIPNDYSGQVMISFRVQSEPSDAIKSWRICTSENGDNRVLDVTLGNRTQEINLSYTARMALPGFGVSRTQKKNFTDWLASSPSVQSGDPAVIALAKSLEAANQTRTEYVARVVAWVAKNKLRQNLIPGSKDAKSAISGGGDSHARANLCTAILRAAKIPARTIAYTPIWAEKMDALFWLTEFGSDDGDWQMVEPTVGICHPVRDAVCVFSILSLTDEPQDQFKQHAETTIHVIKTFPRNTGARLMLGAFHRSQKVFQSVLKGRAEWYDDAAFNHALSKGPINLALFLDGLLDKSGR